MKKLGFIVALHLILMPISASAVLYDKESLGFSFNECPAINPCDTAFSSHLQKSFPIGTKATNLEKAIEAEKYEKFLRNIEHDDAKSKMIAILRLPDEDEDAIIEWTKSKDGKLVSISGYLQINRGKIKDKAALNQIGYLPPILQDLSPVPYKEWETWLPKSVWKNLNNRLQDLYPIGTPIEKLRHELTEQGFLECTRCNDLEWRFTTKTEGKFYEEWRSNKTGYVGCNGWWYIRVKSEDKKSISHVEGNYTEICT